MKAVERRELVSFDGACPYGCKHCYTYELEERGPRTIDEIVESVSGSDFDIVYVSQRRENFVRPDEGIELCERLFERYACSILAITRSVFSPAQIARLAALADRAREAGRDVFVAVSVVARERSRVTEDEGVIPSTAERLRFVSDLHAAGLKTLLLIRPVFPERVVPIDEVLSLADCVQGHVGCVVAGGLAVNEHIERRLGMSFDACELKDDQTYLNGAMEGDLNFVDVEKEIGKLEDHCRNLAVPFFHHSMPAVNYLASCKVA